MKHKITDFSDDNAEHVYEVLATIYGAHIDPTAIFDSVSFSVDSRHYYLSRTLSFLLRVKDSNGKYLDLISTFPRYKGSSYIGLKIEQHPRLTPKMAKQLISDLRVAYKNALKMIETNLNREGDQLDRIFNTN